MATGSDTMEMSAATKGKTSGGVMWFSAKLPDEIECLLTGIACVSDYILIVDNENRNLKRYTYNGELVDDLKLRDPCGIAGLEHTEDSVVVVEPDCYRIAFVEVKDTLRLTSTHESLRKYESVCYLDSTRLVGGCCQLGESCVDIIDYEGRVLTTIDINDEGRRCFRNPASICRNLKGEILVSDSGHSLLICISTTGQLEFTYDPHERPSGVCVDSANGCLYLCYYDTSVIYQLSQDGEKEKVVLDDTGGILAPLALHATKRYLIATEEMPSDRVLLIDNPNRWKDPTVATSQGSTNQMPNGVSTSNVRVSVLNRALRQQTPVVKDVNLENVINSDEQKSDTTSQDS